MNSQEREITIKEFRERSDAEFDNGGNAMIAAELLWGAFAHGMIAVAELNQWPTDGHAMYGYAARKLRAAHQQERWLSDLAAANRLHSHFYQRHLNPGEIRAARAATNHAIDELIVIMGIAHQREAHSGAGQ